MSPPRDGVAESIAVEVDRLTDATAQAVRLTLDREPDDRSDVELLSMLRGAVSSMQQIEHHLLRRKHRRV